MLHHTRIVLAMLAGHSVGWGAQRRRASGELARAVWSELPATLLGVCTALWLSGSSWLLLWFSPIWLPWLLSIPLDLALSSARLGGLSRRLGLLVVPSELEPEPLLTRIDELRVLTRSDASARFRDLVLDPVLVAAHLARLDGKRSSEPPRKLASLRGRVLRQGPASLSPAEWRVLAEDRESMELLHRQAWRCWPVESWDIGRESQEEPPDTFGDVLAKRRELGGR
jgi:membrane glycosyltransferase